MIPPLRPFEEMTPADYAAIGFKCGLEVHQQLLTKTKLFCRCPAGRYSEAYDAEILRHMRPTLSELGEYDGTALMEKKTRKNIYYRIHRDTVCTYEFDDTPPFFMDAEALDIAIEISLLEHLGIVGELHVARKQYLDGSIPAGFQRTAIVGVDGWIPYKDRRIGILQLSIEEDSCREVSDVGHDRVYLTDRLGMPLIETVTAPDMRTPQEAAEVCQIVRQLCRSTGRVRTGYGATRQDVNVSVTGGTRIEIKGVPQIWRIPLLVHNEAQRQCALLNIREVLHQRGVTRETLAHSIHDVTRVLAKAHFEPIRAALASGMRVKCVVLRGFAGLFNAVTQQHTTFAKEFSDRVRVIACLTRLPNLIHSDSATESLAARDWKELYKKTTAGSGDALVLVWGDEADTVTACEEIVIRAREATEGIPRDTRQALKDGTTGFERVLPGAERMYPDTDLPPLAIDAARLVRIQSRLPEHVWKREARLEEMGLSAEFILALSRSGRGALFDRLIDELKLSPVLAATILSQRLKALRRAGCRPDRLTDEELFEAFRAFAAGSVSREGIPTLIEYMLTHESTAPGPAARVAETIEALGIRPMSDNALTDAIHEAIRQANSRHFETPEIRHRYLMGVLMKQKRGSIGGGRLASMLTQSLSRVENRASPAGISS